MSNQSSPHDAVFRRILGEPASAASQLRAVLPPKLVARIDLDQLVAVPGSVVDASLQWRHSDLIFQVPLDGHDAFVYSRHAWAHPTELLDLLDLDDAAHDAALSYLPRFRFLLDDLSGTDVAGLRSRPLTPVTRVTLLLLKIASGNTDIDSDLGEWADQLLTILDEPGGIERFMALVTYIERVAETPADRLHRFFSNLGPDAEEVYMTTAEMLRAEGRAEGRAQVLLQQLTVKFGPLADTTRDAVRSATPDQLDTWAARILTATSMDEVLRSPHAP